MIYDQALGGVRMPRTAASGMLGLAQQAQMPDRPPLPVTQVGNVDFEGGVLGQQQQAQQQQAYAQQQQGQILSGISGLAEAGLNWWQNRPQPGMTNSFQNEAGYLISGPQYRGPPRGTLG